MEPVDVSDKYSTQYNITFTVVANNDFVILIFFTKILKKFSLLKMR